MNVVADSTNVWMVALIIAGLIGVIGLIAYVVRQQFTPEARERRRCRRNHRRVVSRARRPIVMLSAKVPKA